jgi:asparagine N-glycosylation enzyme membrane subunit Stt3
LNKLLNFSKKYIDYIILGIIICGGLYIRSKPISKLGGKYFLESDPYLFARYTEYIVGNGKIMALDMMRNYPVGYNPRGENILISYIISYLYKIIHFLISSLSTYFGIIDLNIS